MLYSRFLSWFNGREILPIIQSFRLIDPCYVHTPHKINGFNRSWLAVVNIRLCSLTSDIHVLKLPLMRFCTEGREILPTLIDQPVNETGGRATRQQRPLLNLWPANCWALRSPHHRTCRVVFYHYFGVTEMKSQAYAQYGTMGRVYPGCSRDVVSLRSVRVFFSGTQRFSAIKFCVKG